MAGKGASAKPEIIEAEIRICPICGEEATSPHHIRPRSLGGTDDDRNIVWLCKTCHDMVEEIQEREQIEFSPDLVNKLRLKRHIKFAEDENGVSERRLNRDGRLFVVWVVLPNPDKTKKGLKKVVNQFIEELPPGAISQPKESGESDELKRERKGIISLQSTDRNILRSETGKIEVTITKKQKRPVGHPKLEEIDTGYIEELVYNNGFSYRDAARELSSQGYHISHTFIMKRLRQGKRYKAKRIFACKCCGKIFKPDGARTSYCSDECNTRARRRGPRKGKSELIKKGVKAQQVKRKH